MLKKKLFSTKIKYLPNVQLKSNQFSHNFDSANWWTNIQVV